MTPADLKKACDQAGGVYQLAEMIGKRPQYIYRRLRGQVDISRLDALGIRMALEDAAALDALKALFTSGAVYDPEDDPKITAAISGAMKVLP